ncbi:MAG: hypothetical protein HON90_08720 [Halobacteriovoraceae bacterium]|nr:hypothetical protein [Halobacteriovoraceae bacterium]
MKIILTLVSLLLALNAYSYGFPPLQSSKETSRVVKLILEKAKEGIRVTTCTLSKDKTEELKLVAGIYASISKCYDYSVTQNYQMDEDKLCVTTEKLLQAKFTSIDHKERCMWIDSSNYSNEFGL